MGARLGRVGVLGLARSGAATARYLAERLGGDVDRVLAYDSSDTEGVRRVARELEALGVETHLGAGSVEDGLDLVVASPGIPPHAPLLVAARASGARLVSELEFAFQESASPWIGITGTNGKTTTTHLVGHLLTSSGIVNVRVGNIGTPAIGVVERTDPSTVIVAEVSSFQLALADSFHPRVAILLNITPDHLDWHGSHESYVADKGRIFENMGAEDVAVINVDDEGSAPFASRVGTEGVRVVRVSQEQRDDVGAHVADGVLVLREPSGVKPLVAIDELQLRGAHNVGNALAAAAAAHAVGARLADIADGLRTFAPIEHRLQPVGEIDGVEYVNDSKATNTDAARTALAAYADGSVILLLGGRSKGASFDGLAADAERSARTVIVFGEARTVLAEAFSGRSVPVLVVETLADAVELAAASAEAGDVVLLSPACASFDEFDDYERRGEAFAAAVSSLTSRSEVL